MPRNKTITDDEILAAARSLFLQEGAKASTRTLAKQAGISETVIFQRFGTKEELFFAAMVPPKMHFRAMFEVQPGQKPVTTNLEIISLQIVAYFREMMPIFLALISHPSFDMQTFLQQHTLPAVQIKQELNAYLNAEADLGRIQPDKGAVVASVLLSHLHNLALSETIEAHRPTDTERATAEAIDLLWQGLEPQPINP